MAALENGGVLLCIHQHCSSCLGGIMSVMAFTSVLGQPEPRPTQGSQLDLPAPPLYAGQVWLSGSQATEYRGGRAPSPSYRPGMVGHTASSGLPHGPRRRLGTAEARSPLFGLCVPICELGCLPHFKLMSDKIMLGKPCSQQSHFCLQVLYSQAQRHTSALSVP